MVYSKKSKLQKLFDERIEGKRVVEKGKMSATGQNFQPTALYRGAIDLPRGGRRVAVLLPENEQNGVLYFFRRNAQIFVDDFFITLPHDGRKRAVFGGTEMPFGVSGKEPSDKTVRPDFEAITDRAAGHDARRPRQDDFIEKIFVRRGDLHRDARTEGMRHNVGAMQRERTDKPTRFFGIIFHRPGVGQRRRIAEPREIKRGDAAKTGKMVYLR